MTLRFVVFAVLGALLSSLGIFVYLIIPLLATNAQPFSIGIVPLLFEVMKLHYYALFGAVVGSLVAPFPPRPGAPFTPLLWWTVIGFAVGLLVQGVIMITLQKTVPDAPIPIVLSLLLSKFTIAGIGIGFLLSVIQTVRTWLFEPEATPSANDLNPILGHDADSIIKEYWHDKADGYLRDKRDS